MMESSEGGVCLAGVGLSHCQCGPVMLHPIVVHPSGTQSTSFRVSPWGCPFEHQAPVRGLESADALRFSAPAVRTSVTSRYEMRYRSTTGQEEAALAAATARGIGAGNCWGAPFPEAG